LRWNKTAELTGGIARPEMATRARSLPDLPTCQAGERTLLGFSRPAPRLGLAADDQDLPALGVDDLGAPIAAKPEPEVEPAPQPLDEGDLAVAVEVAQRRGHLSFPCELDRPQRGEEEERDGKDEDESEQETLLLQDSTR
jgi:hypothetical protein